MVFIFDLIEFIYLHFILRAGHRQSENTLPGGAPMVRSLLFLFSYAVIYP
jgi:hypothetical protein